MPHPTPFPVHHPWEVLADSLYCLISLLCVLVAASLLAVTGLACNLGLLLVCLARITDQPVSSVSTETVLYPTAHPLHLV